jgi:CrcB protein
MVTHYFGQILIVGLGGFIGSGLRFMLHDWAAHNPSLSDFPWGTLAVNVIGCLMIGFVVGLIETKNVLLPWQRLFLLVGILGGFTTFSTFAIETVALTLDHSVIKALFNILLQVVLGVLAAAGGFYISRLA